MKTFLKGLSVGAALAALFVCGTCAAQPVAEVAKPEVKVDDRWVYRSTDRRRKPPTGIYEIRVTFVDSRAIHAVVEPQGRQRRESDATWTPEWNTVVSVDEGVYYVEQGLFQFPLAPGRQYRAAWEIRRPRSGAFHVRHERKVTVVGWEDAEVPAGKFRALKLQADVPQVKRWVKHVYQDVQLELVDELYFYRVQ